jgi:hypothetical protein
MGTTDSCPKIPFLHAGGERGFVFSGPSECTSTPLLPLLESGVLYFCPPIDCKEVHLAYEEFNKANYVPEVPKTKKSSMQSLVNSHSKLPAQHLMKN